MLSCSAELSVVSDPRSKRYGHHLTKHDVDRLIRPEEESSRQVKSWLEDHGIKETSLRYSAAQDWIYSSLPVRQIEKLLNTRYSIYRHEDGSEMVRALNWSLPLHLHDHIDRIQPTNSFFRVAPQAMSTRAGTGRKRSIRTVIREGNSTVCDSEVVSMNCLRKLYGTFHYKARSTIWNKMGLVNYLGKSNNRSDTYLFLSKFRPEAKSAAYEFQFDVVANGSTVQHHPENELEENAPDGEGDLDVEVMIGLAWPTPLIAYSFGGAPPFAPDHHVKTDTNEPYLAWLSYVLSTSDEEIAKVISTSYDDDEQAVPFTYARRACNELAQLGARGVSLFFASGDYGVGPSGSCFSNNGSDAATFLPQFPSSCPFVTSVGATMDFNPEIVASHRSGFSSGGGFSQYFARPDYQNSAVTAYMAGLNGSSSGLYNPEGRAYSDFAAQGSYYNIVWNGTTDTASGTSASTPAVAAIFALVNDALVTAGKPTMGFLNPRYVTWTLRIETR